ncbi:hypothetical protein L2E82_45240 [Cichorium intybus]|uniref:Uncharacterized protein n=1 Tax=Cichorium intybus TaxID=13427 RepID=A0ACB8ZRJ7_CICIN|nr:hypothetical protein L2E82_45240 [Cichorium intybus]
MLENVDVVKQPLRKGMHVLDPCVDNGLRVTSYWSDTIAIVDSNKSYPPLTPSPSKNEEEKRDPNPDWGEFEASTTKEYHGQKSINQSSISSSLVYLVDILRRNHASRLNWRSIGKVRGKLWWDTAEQWTMDIRDGHVYLILPFDMGPLVLVGGDPEGGKSKHAYVISKLQETSIALPHDAEKGG